MDLIRSLESFLRDPLTKVAQALMWLTVILAGFLLLGTVFGNIGDWQTYDDFTRRSLESFLRDPLTNIVPRL